MAYVSNPIRKGFYPDPSLCRVGNTYYCVHSSFGCAPGIPVFRSQNLVEWEQIGHALVREDQLRLKGAEISGGIYAPTIRYHKGIFYITATNVTIGHSFYITAEKAEGPWSDPWDLKNAPGIDPSLYFEGEKCYYIGQRQKAEAAYFGDCEIWIQELNLTNHQLTGKPAVLWDGAMKQCRWPEGPHLYRRGDYYYLLIAEGGTEYHHSISVARSHRLFGPYESCPDNPVFTHRHLGHRCPIQNVGHGDFVDTPSGDWYILMLGTRLLEGRAELGRETFLADVSWEDDWPVINAGEGKLRRQQRVGPEGEQEDPRGIRPGAKETRYEIQWKKPLDLRLVGVRGFLPDMGACSMKNGVLLLPAAKKGLETPGVLPFLAVRMESRQFCISVQTNVARMNDASMAGLACFYDEKNYLLLGVDKGSDEMSLSVVSCVGGRRRRLAQRKINGEKTDGAAFALRLEGRQQKAALYAAEECLMADVDLGYMSSEAAGGFVGCLLGVYAEGHGQAMFGPVSIKMGE